MNEEAMKQIAHDLIELKREFPKDRLKIVRNRDKGLEFCHEYDYHKHSAYDFDDTRIIAEVRSLAQQYRAVFVIINADSQKTEVYIPPDKEAYPEEEASANQPSSGCFIATATFDSADALEVMALRTFRNQVLSASRVGQWFIRLYYHISPKLAAIIVDSPRLKQLSRLLLTRLVSYLPGID
jgi:hypothetical protein